LLSRARTSALVPNAIVSTSSISPKFSNVTLAILG